jgi:PHD/YefM family antitoxin component YafN of YafNO toxin-antitoxin module
MGELMETFEILSDPEMVKAIEEGQADIKAGRVKELRTLPKEDAC